VAVGDGAIWETFHCFASVPIPDFFDECPRPQDVLLRIDSETFEVEGRSDFGRTLLNRSLDMDVSRSFDTIVVGDDILWVSDPVGSKIWSVDPKTGEVSAPIALEASDGLAADEASAWVLDRDLGTVTRVDPVEGIGETVRVGSDPTDMTSGLEAIWVSDSEGVLWRVDLVTHDVTTIEIGAPLASIAVDEATDSLWLAVFDTEG
jgi:streptogramin lyase